MKKIAILGCENSHADQFLNFIKNKPEFSDVEVVGIYSDESEPVERLTKRFEVPALANYDSAVGQVDGIIITARHGNNHMKYALPYIESGIPMFIDKPFTINEDEALDFARRLRDANIRVTGGSSLAREEFVCSLAEDVKNRIDGNTVGGCIRAPLDINSPYGGFYFYAQHLCEMVMKIYGRYPEKVYAVRCENQVTVIFRYEKNDITGLFVNESYVYFASRFAERGCKAERLDLSKSLCFYNEFKAFYDLLCGEEQAMSYEDFIAPVFVMNAVERSLNSGKEEEVKRFEI